MQQILIAFLLPSVVLFGSGDDQPGWVKNGRDARFAEALFVQAIGVASKYQNVDENQLRAEAEDQVRNAIAQQLQVRITAQSISIKFESVSGDIVRDQSVEKMVSSTNVTLSGLRIEGHYFDQKRKTYHALAVLDRRIAMRAMRDEVLTLQRGAESALASAKARADSNDVLQTIIDSRRAYQLLQAAEARRRLLSVLETNVVGTQAIPDAPTLEQPLRVLSNAARTLRIELDPLSIVVASRTDLPIIIKAKLSADFAAVPNAALSCSFRKGRGRVSVHDRTDANGQVSVIVDELGTAPGGEYQLEIRFDTSELVLHRDQTSASAWNATLQQTIRPAYISFRRLDLEVADFCADAVADLAGQLENIEKPFQLALGNITYEETGAASPFVAYLKEQIITELARWPNVELIAPETLDRGLREARSTYHGDKRPDTPEVLAELVGANGIVTGTYWDRAEQLEFKLRIIQRNSSVTLASATMQFPKSLIPDRFPYVPANFASFTEAHGLDKVDASDGGLQVDVWVDRADGAIYRTGEKMTIFVRTTQDCYLYLIYHDAGGADILIFPNARQANNRILGGVIYQIPDARDSFEFAVQKPFGSELLKAVASSALLPDLPGELLPNGLKRLKKPYKKSLVRLRSIGMQSRTQGYSEGSCVVTTVE